MPPPVIYVVAAVVGVAAVAYALKEFVYEPHIAPTLEAWAEDFLERRRMGRNRGASAVGVPASRRRRRDSDTSSHPSQDNEDAPPGNGRDRTGRVTGRASGSNDLAAEAYELDPLASKEVKEWRNEVLRSQETGNQGLRRRRTDRSSHDIDGFDTMSTTFDESFSSLTHTPISSAHVISNVSSPMTPGTTSLAPTPTGRLRSHSQSTTTEGGAHTVSPSSVTPLAIPNGVSSTPRSPVNDNPSRPLPFTPTYQRAADDSPFGPLLPDTPRSSAEIYGERPFSPISRVMVASSGSSSVSSGTLVSRANSMNSSRTFGNSGTPRRGSSLVNEVVMSNSDSESDGGDTSLEHVPSSVDNTTLASITSLSERYPAPPTPPVVVSPPTSSVGIISAPSSPRSGGSEVVINDFSEFQSPPQTLVPPSVPMLRVPHSATSPALSYASFLSPSASRAPSESGDEFMSVADDASDWGAAPLSPLTLGGRTGPVADSSHNPFLIFEELSSPGDIKENGSELGGESDGSEVVVSDLAHEAGSEVGSDESWGSARRH